jgi:tetratricopeptide (TPR) repeat protein
MVFVASALFVIALLPNLGLVPFDFQRYSTVADRYAYFAMLGPALLLAWFVQRSLDTLPARTVALASMLLLLSLVRLTAVQLSFWQSSVPLFEHALTVNPSSPIMRYNLGVVQESAGQFDAAIDEYLQTVRFDPENASAHCNLAGLLAVRHRDSEAMTHYALALKADPDLAAAHDGIALILAAHGGTAAAVAHWRRAAALAPAGVDTRYNLGLALGSIGDYAGAAIQLKAASNIDPGFAPARTALANVLAKEMSTKAITKPPNGLLRNALLR